MNVDLFNKSIEFDKKGIEFHEKYNWYPDYYAINSTIMYDIYQSMKENESVMNEPNNSTYIQYVGTVVEPRHNEKSENFRNSINSYYFDDNTYINFLLNYQKKDDDYL